MGCVDIIARYYIQGRLQDKVKFYENKVDYDQTKKHEKLKATVTKSLIDLGYSPKEINKSYEYIDTKYTDLKDAFMVSRKHKKDVKAAVPTLYTRVMLTRYKRFLDYIDSSLQQ